MRCSKCAFENPEGMKFCGQCTNPLALICPKCRFQNPPGFKFCGQCTEPLSALEIKAAPPIRMGETADNAEAVDGERKTVTALFADIKGSMELIEDLDPEEARRLVDPALKLMMDAVHRYEGYVAQSTGDGIFALFGAPIAHEDHPQRALFSALRMQEDLKRYADKLRERGQPPLSVRVGVNNGEVVVRAIQTGDAHTEYAPIGHSVSLASRLQTLAAPGSVVIGESVQKLVEGYFQLKPLGASRIKGVSEPVEVFEVTGLGPLRTRLQRAAGRGLTKFVGRDREIATLKHTAEQARAGHGQIVAVMAEPGVGKSRLFFEFKATSQSGRMLLEAYSVSHGKASAYLPVIDLLRNYFRIANADDDRTRREKVAGKITILDRSLEDTLPYLFNLLGIVEGDDTLAQMDGQIRKRRTLEAIKRILLRESLNQPLMVIFEDLHWIDEETRELLNLLADSIGTAKFLLLVNYRPEYSHQWNNKTYYTQLRLDPLGKESAEEMLSTLLGDGNDLIPLKRLIIQRAEGTPFFMEEIVQALFEDGVLQRNGAVKLARSMATVKVPATVQAILASRIDRLPPGEKDLLQTLAVIGREFALLLVRRVIDGGDDDLERMLAALQMAEFVYEQPTTGDIEYTFKHALTQEVAYNSLLIERRKLLHGRAGEALESMFAGQLDDHLDELARHYSRSGNLSKAVEYLRLAAHQAAQRSSYPEAIAYVNSALEILAGLPQSEQRDRDELLLRVSLGVSLMAAKGFDSDELERSFARGAILARDLKETIFLFAMLNGLWGFHFTRGHLKLALAICQELMAVAEQLNDPGSIRDAHSAMGAALGYAGDLLAARRHLEQAAALTNAPRTMGRPYRLGPDPSVLCLTALAGVLFELGYPDQALKRAYQAMAAVDADSDPFSLVMAMVFAAEIHCSRREAAKGEELARALLAICAERGYPFWQSVGRRMLGWALGQQGHVREAIELMEQEMQRLTEPQAQIVHIWVLLSIADGCETIGETQRALSLLDQWRTVRDKLELGMRDSFYYRLRARLFLRSGADEEAEKTFRKAIEAAVVRNARSEELRSTLYLARLLMKHGRGDEARAMLAAIYGWFTEGFDTADLKDAKALLDELSG